MLSHLKSLWRYGNHFCGMEIFSEDGGVKYAAVTAQKKKGEFSDLTFVEGSTFGEVVNKIGKNRHAYLTINTEKVLIKQVNRDSDVQKVLSAAFPGLSPSEFYFEVVHAQEHSFVAVCRKEVVEEFIKEIEQEKWNVLGFRLGFSSIPSILGFLETDRVVLSRQILQLEGDRIRAFSNILEGKTIYSMDGIDCHSNFLLALSSLFGYISDTVTFSNDKEKNKLLQQKHLERNFFRKGLVIGIALLLGILLVNMLYYTSYRKKFQQFKAETELASVQKAVLSQKATEVERKERIANNILKSGNSKSSFYINRIVVSSPASMIFSEITFQPLEKPIRGDQPIKYSRNTLAVQGASKDKEAFSNWVESLENLEWIRTVTVSDYGTDSPGTDTFNISLILEHDTAE